MSDRDSGGNKAAGTAGRSRPGGGKGGERQVAARRTQGDLLRYSMVALVVTLAFFAAYSYALGNSGAPASVGSYQDSGGGSPGVDPYGAPAGGLAAPAGGGAAAGGG